jgi:hypothetical protein
MIVGITHDSDGRAIQRLSVSTKIAIGLPPNGDRNHPIKLDHFVFLKKKTGKEGLQWELDPELMAHYGLGYKPSDGRNFQELTRHGWRSNSVNSEEFIFDSEWTVEGTPLKLRYPYNALTRCHARQDRDFSRHV